MPCFIYSAEANATSHAGAAKNPSAGTAV